ncbi:MAG: 3-hydroxyacyl-CoA dehydrogenase [Alcaligenaceae bacterium]|nr:MAG: 3-hydroxyacyl-CoA dehydrogenase [Alcaligenaceae bacterium]
MSYQIIQAEDSRSFPQAHAFFEKASKDGTGVVYIGADAGEAYQEAHEQHMAASFVAIELGNECLGVHLADDAGPSNVVGFARFRLGDDAPTQLIELVRMPYTSNDALAAAKAAFEGADLTAAVCNDFPGRILNRLIRPYYNAALRRLDEGLASANDMDMTLRLGLGYPEGPIALLNRSGLHHHFEVTQDLYEQLGQESYAPARRARNAWLKQFQAHDDATS